jgi:hypothetical protein
MYQINDIVQWARYDWSPEPLTVVRVDEFRQCVFVESTTGNQRRVWLSDGDIEPRTHARTVEWAAHLITRFRHRWAYHLGNSAEQRKWYLMLQTRAVINHDRLLRGDI